jgi:hypothetical protein
LPSKPAQSYRVRVLLPLDWLIFGFLAYRKVYYSFGELVHIARARRTAFAHVVEYGAARLSLQRRLSMRGGKLSHCRKVWSVFATPPIW